jgi:thioredoxin 1
MSRVQALMEADFVAATSGFALLDFWAPWCVSCQQLVKPLEIIAERFSDQDVRVFKVNVDENPLLAATLRVLTLPTLILFHDGQPVEVMVGAKTHRELEAVIARHLAVSA